MRFFNVLIRKASEMNCGYSVFCKVITRLIMAVSTETAQSALGGSDVSDAVITVPSEFAHAQKRALR